MMNAAPLPVWIHIQIAFDRFPVVMILAALATVLGGLAPLLYDPLEYNQLFINITVAGFINWVLVFQIAVYASYRPFTRRGWLIAATMLLLFDLLFVLTRAAMTTNWTIFTGIVMIVCLMAATPLAAFAAGLKSRTLREFVRCLIKNFLWGIVSSGALFMSIAGLTALIGRVFFHFQFESDYVQSITILSLGFGLSTALCAGVPPLTRLQSAHAQPLKDTIRFNNFVVFPLAVALNLFCLIVFIAVLGDLEWRGAAGLDDEFAFVTILYGFPLLVGAALLVVHWLVDRLYSADESGTVPGQISRAALGFSVPGALLITAHYTIILIGALVKWPGSPGFENENIVFLATFGFVMFTALAIALPGLRRRRYVAILLGFYMYAILMTFGPIFV